MATGTTSRDEVEVDDDVRRAEREEMEKDRVLVLEPFYGGSHRQLLDTLRKEFSDDEFVLHTLPAKKWHWRARTSALYFSQIIAVDSRYKALFSSSVLNLAELIALRKDLGDLRKVIYFHENQLTYPRQSEKERDFQYGYNQILTCLVADVVLFNSTYNLDSFLNNIETFLKKQPDFRAKNLREEILPKCQVLYFPMDYTVLRTNTEENNSPLGPSNPTVHVAWPHRWEHDKNFDDFYVALKGLKEAGKGFVFSVLGQSYGEVPEVFERARKELSEHIVHFGYVESKEEYYKMLRKVDVVVSTAKHEFFGVAMLEATYLGCLPLCPRALVYGELYPDWCLFAPTATGLLEKLKEFVVPEKVREMKESLKMHWERYDARNLLPEFRRILLDTSNDLDEDETVSKD